MNSRQHSARVLAPRRAAASSPTRLASGVGLLLGTVLAVGAAFGPPELVRVGVAIAVATAVLAGAGAGRELRATRRQHAREMLAASRASAQVLGEERRRNAVVVEALTVRAQEASVTVERQATSLAVLRGELATLRGDRAHLVTEIGHRDAAILALRDTVRAREAELVALRDDADDAEVHALPRRVRTETGAASEDVSEVTSLWADASPPAETDVPAAAVIMPNYEVDRRLA